MTSAYSVPSESQAVLQNLLKDARLCIPEDVVGFAKDVNYTGSDSPYLPVPFKFTEAISALKGLEAAFAAAIATRRFGSSVRAGRVEINTDHAALFVFSAFTVTVDGKPASPAFVPKMRDWDIYDSLKHRYRQLATSIYKTKDGRYFHLHGSLNAKPTQTMVGMDHSRIDITDESEIADMYQNAVGAFDADAIQSLAHDTYRQAGVICYKEDELDAVPQIQAIKDCPIYELYLPASPSQPCPWPQASSNKCLSGIKVLEFTRIIAAPAVGRSLAENGATVLRITSPNNPDFHVLNADMSCGKLNAFLDLKTDEGKNKAMSLILDADVIIDGYRPGCLEGLGFGRKAVEEMVAHRKDRGIVYVRENTYGFHGPWEDRSGWQQIADCFTGLSWTFGQKLGIDEPVVPIFPNADFGTGAIGCIAVLHALYLRSIEGGSYGVDIALAYYNLWLKTLGLYPDTLWEDIRPQVPLRHYMDMIMMLRGVLPPLVKSRPDVFANPDFWQLIDAPSYGGIVRVPKAVNRYSGGLEVGFERPPTQNGDDPAEWL